MGEGEQSCGQMLMTEELNQSGYKCLFCYFNLSEVFRVKNGENKRQGTESLLGEFVMICFPTWVIVTKGPSTCNPSLRLCILFRAHTICQSECFKITPYSWARNIPGWFIVMAQQEHGPGLSACGRWGFHQVIRHWLSSHLFRTSGSEFHIQNVMGNGREEEQREEKA